MPQVLLQSSPDLEQTLKERFGFPSFKASQREIIERTVSGQDTLAILATGAGKSLCYQLAALVLEGTTVVVSPLIALMKDQLDMLLSAGITDIVALNSSLTEDEEAKRYDQLRSGKIKIIFVTPERLEDARCIEVLQKLHIPLFVVDEAHCISTWGHDFRPAYLGLRQVIAQLGTPTILALTATATPNVRDDILVQLGIPHVQPIVCGFDRPALVYGVQRTESDLDKVKFLAKIINENPGDSGIIYTATIKNALIIQKALAKSCSSPIALYHSRLKKHERTAVHELFMGNNVPIVVATNAFGLGIDKANIRFVIHYEFPGSLEAYTQEVGRAGRDGAPSRCILLYRMKDMHIQKYFLTGKYPDAADVQRVYRTLECFSAQDEGVTLTDLRKISQLPLTKLKVVLALLSRAQIAVSSGRNRFRLVASVRPGSEQALQLTSYQSKQSYDQSKLAMMLQYAESTSCRRKFILNYFGENFSKNTCKGCDNCLNTSQKMRTLQSPLTPTNPGEFQIADQVQHPTFGEGSVERVERDLVTVLFPKTGYKTLLASAVGRLEGIGVNT